MTTTRRGRPAMDWLSVDELGRLDWATPILLDTLRPTRRTIGRLGGQLPDGSLVVVDRAGMELTFPGPKVVRGRVLASPYTSGDLLLKRGKTVDEWRGGVIRQVGRKVYVESTEGIAWMDEDELLPAEEELAAATA